MAETVPSTAERVAVLGATPAGVHQALVSRQLSDRVTLLTHTAPPDGEAREQLAAVVVTPRHLARGELYVQLGGTLPGGAGAHRPRCPLTPHR